MMKMVLEIGYAHWVVDPCDAIVLLDIASRSIKVSHPSCGKPCIQDANPGPFVTKAELVEYEPLALPGPDLYAPEMIEPAPTPPPEIPF